MFDRAASARTERAVRSGSGSHCRCHLASATGGTAARENDSVLAKLTGIAAVLAVVLGLVVIVLAQLMKEGYFARSTTPPRSTEPGIHDAKKPSLGLNGRRWLIAQFALLAVVLSGILAVVTYYGAPTELFRNRVVAGVWGLFIGIPGAAALVTRMNPPHRDDE